MTQFDGLINLIFNIQIWGLFKILTVVGIFIYVLFSLVIIRQVDLMTEVLSGRLNPGIKIVAFIHLGFAIVVLISALLFL
jgi:hypothetical protein